MSVRVRCQVISRSTRSIGRVGPCWRDSLRVLRSGQSGTGIDIQTKTLEVPVGDADPRRVGITYGMTPVRPFGVRWRGEDGAPRRPRASTPAERSRSCPSHALLKRTEPALPELSSRAKTLY